MFSASWSDLLQNWASRSRVKKTGMQPSVRRRTRPAGNQSAVESLEERLVLSAIVVTGIGDSIAADGFVTLNEALTSINTGVNVNADVTGIGAYGLNDTVSFSIAGAGVHKILQGTALPTIVKPVIIDGYSQLGSIANTSLTTDNAVLLIELDGSSALPGINGLTLGAGSDQSVIKGLAIHGFSGNGIGILSDANTITGNFIGTDVTGNLGGSPTGAFGIEIDGGLRNTIGGTAPADRNVIGGNSDGINLNNSSQSNVIQGNLIGVGADGISAVGNRLHGVALQGNNGQGVQGNQIGGIAAGAGNSIANNGLAGVAVFGSALSPHQNSGNSILGNSIYNNGLSSPATIPGIDLTGTLSYPVDDGVTSNDLGDADSGPNDLQNYPVLTSTQSSLVSTTVVGYLNSNALTTYRIEFFSSPTASGTGFGEARTFLGFTNVTTDSTGNVNFTATVQTTVPNGYYVTATATGGGTAPGGVSPVSGPNKLGTAESFVILAGSTITSTGATSLIGDVGLSPGSEIVGTIITTGTIHVADPVAVQAKADLVTAFNYFAGLTPSIDLTGQELGGLTLTPGIYHFDTSAQLTGPQPLILDTLGDPHAVFVFQIGSTLTTAVGSSVVVAGGPDDSIFWEVGSSATIGIGSAFVGNVLAQTSITFNTGATLASGRALAIVGAVTLDGITADSTTLSQSNTSEISAPVQASLFGVSPVALADVYGVAEDTVLTVNAANGVLANDTDGDSDPLTAILEVGPAHGILALSLDGSFTYSPNANYHGADTFTYHANDGTTNSLPAVVTLTIASVNDAPPVSIIDNYAATEDTVLTVTAANGVLANDTDVDGDPLTAILDVGPTHGTLVFNATGSFVYTPNSNYHGSDSFTYHANDGTGNSLPAVVTLTIASVNDAPPIAIIDSYAATEDTVLTVTAANGVLANDTDVDGDPLTATLDVGPTHGTLVFNATGSFVYTPNSKYHGSDSFTYHANDGTGNSLPAVVTLTIASTNAPPVSSNDAFFIDEDATLNVPTVTGVLANDTDPDGNTMTVALVTASTHGTVVLNSDGSFVYTPNSDFNGSDSFTYRANDGRTTGNLATVTITVNPENEAPIIITSPGTTAAKGHRRTVIDQAINLIDPDSPNFSGGHLDVAIQSGRGRRDSLSYRHGGANKGRVNARRGELRIGHTAIGSITGGLHGTPLHVQFNSDATLERVQVVMQKLTFCGTHSQPGERVISWQITDNTGLDSDVETKSVDVR